MRRATHRDTLGYTRPIPLLLGTRLRLALPWAYRRHPVVLVAAAVVVTLLAGALLAAATGPPSREAPCHPAVTQRAALCP